MSYGPGLAPNSPSRGAVSYAPGNTGTTESAVTGFSVSRASCQLAGLDTNVTTLQRVRSTMRCKHKTFVGGLSQLVLTGLTSTQDPSPPEA